MANLKRLNNQMKWHIQLEALSPIHIGGSHEKIKNEPKKDSKALNVALLEWEFKDREKAENFLIPGSSFRGVTRNYLETLAEQFKLRNMPSYIEGLYGFSKGRNSLKGRIWFGDILIPRSAKVVKHITPIDRVTQKAIPLTYEAIEAGTTFTLEVAIDNASVYELGLMALLLRALEQETLTIGSAKGRGLGRIKLKSCVTEITSFTKQVQTDDKHAIAVDNFEKITNLLGTTYRQQADGQDVYTWLQFAADALQKTVVKEA